MPTPSDSNDFGCCVCVLHDQHIDGGFSGAHGSGAGIESLAGAVCDVLVDDSVGANAVSDPVAMEPSVRAVPGPLQVFTFRARVMRDRDLPPRNLGRCEGAQRGPSNDGLEIIPASAWNIPVSTSNVRNCTSQKNWRFG